MRNFDPHKPRCYMVYALAPETVTMRQANDQFNDFISHPEYGFVLCHDHFVDRAGGFAIFYVENENQYQLLSSAPELRGWSIAVHPLTFMDAPAGFLYQSDFTMTVYRKRRLKDLVTEYEASELARDMDERAATIS